ncbi:MAG: 4'-phosphopantetheinyl transferase superfamily protein [Betaproteobacteria bacterium]|nr:4'-phosphopantetheinyl transferase superfamily protein [Betaproteobacteria bacterium]MSQ88267.1 4'-phosphopantetheinyl transferase superfamily protein [Betaproteobacteria bacterium]
MSVQSLVLRHGKIEQRVYFAAVDAEPPQEFLSEREKAQLAGFQFAAKKQAFLLGRLAAKRALGALLLEPDLRQIEIRSGIYGQPLVHHPRAGSAQVSVSHSQGLAVALAFPAEVPMGIDLETVSAVAAETIISALEASAPELAWLATAGVDQAIAYCVLWTAREALGKALKIGLNSPLGVLALSDIRAIGEISSDEGSWAGRYLNFPQSQCLSQVQGDRVLSLAMPREAELNSQLQIS